MISSGAIVVGSLTNQANQATKKRWVDTTTVSGRYNRVSSRYDRILVGCNRRLWYKFYIRETQYKVYVIAHTVIVG
jgi:hypothetical protein